MDSKVKRTRSQEATTDGPLRHESVPPDGSVADRLLPVSGPEPHKLGLVAYLSNELGWGSALGWSRPVNRPGEGAMAGFLRVPWFMEKFLIFGHALAVDLFLFHFTLLPLRILFSASMLILSVIKIAFKAITPKGLWNVLAGSEPKAVPGSVESRRASSGTIFQLTRAGLYDVLKGLIIFTATMVLGMVQVSRVYHYIRGEAIIKLYVIFNILEIVDKLCASVGTDIMDALYRTLRDDRDLETVGKWLHGEPTDDGEGGSSGAAADSHGLESIGIFRLLKSLTTSKASDWKPLLGCARLGWQVILAVIYVTFHSCVIFVQIVCLNVALNSRNNSLLTLLISNNFVELKGSVFKKFEPANLFQIACADAVERFQLALFLSLIILQEGASTNLISAALFIWGAEMVVDSVKHSFVCKFNRLHADLYSTFTAILAHDYVSVRGRIKTSLDPTHACVRRLGLSPIPLCCVLLRVTLTNVHPSWFPRAVTSATGFFALFAMIICLALAKLALSMLLLAYSSRVINEQRGRLVAAAERAQIAALGTTGAVGAAGPSASGVGVGQGISPELKQPRKAGHAAMNGHSAGGSDGHGSSSHHDGASGASGHSDLIRESARGHQKARYDHHSHGTGGTTEGTTNGHHSVPAESDSEEQEEEVVEDDDADYDHERHEHGLLHPAMTATMMLAQTRDKKLHAAPSSGSMGTTDKAGLSQLSPGSLGTAGSLAPTPAGEIRPDFERKYLLGHPVSHQNSSQGLPGVVARRAMQKKPSSASSSLGGFVGSGESSRELPDTEVPHPQHAPRTPVLTGQPQPQQQQQHQSSGLAGLPNRPFVLTAPPAAARTAAAALSSGSESTPLASNGHVGLAAALAPGGGLGRPVAGTSGLDHNGHLLSPGGICATPLLSAEHARLSAEYQSRQRMLMMTIVAPPETGRKLTRDSIKEEEYDDDADGNSSASSASSGSGSSAKSSKGEFKIHGRRGYDGQEEDKGEEQLEEEATTASMTTTMATSTMMMIHGSRKQLAAAIPITEANTATEEEGVPSHAGGVGSAFPIQQQKQQQQLPARPVPASGTVVAPAATNGTKAGFLKLTSPANGQRLVARVRLPSSSSTTSASSSTSAGNAVVSRPVAVVAGPPRTMATGTMRPTTTVAPPVPLPHVGHHAPLMMQTSTGSEYPADGEDGEEDEGEGGVRSAPIIAAAPAPRQVSASSSGTIGSKHKDAKDDDAASLFTKLREVERYSSYQGRAVPL
jgi:transmembrane anterior posterior transformation protein 1